MKWCNACVEQDYRNRDLAYWRVNHQRPGSWVCREHGVILQHKRVTGKNFPWTLPKLVVDHNEVTVADQLLIFRVDQAIQWFCKKSSVDASILEAMLRYRLWKNGLLRNELKILATELSHLDEIASTVFKSINLPDFGIVNSKPWFSRLIVDRRDHKPLVWAMALAWTGWCTDGQLDNEYQMMLARKPQRDMFDELSRVKRRVRAPEKLYEALATSSSMEILEKNSTWQRRDIEAWMRKDKHLRAEWEAQKFLKKQKQAQVEIKRYIQNNPTAQRKDILLNCAAAYRWLKARDPTSLATVLPAAKTWIDRQRAFDF